MFWIAGGKPKTGGITSLAGFFPRIRKAYLIGEAADDFAATLDGKVPYEIDGTLDRAVRAAARDAEASGLKEPVVLLSPACASFDQYRNFEVRGKAFTQLVLALPGMGRLTLRAVAEPAVTRFPRHATPIGDGRDREPRASDEQRTRAILSARIQNAPLTSRKPWRVSLGGTGHGFAHATHAFRRMVVDGRPADAGGHRRAHAGRRRAVARGHAAGRRRLGLDPFYFVNRHILYLMPTVAILLAVSFLTPRQIRRLALIVFVVSLIMVAATPYFGAEIKGARRWLIIFGVNIQPSEFLKPAFVILIAWLFGESAQACRTCRRTPSPCAAAAGGRRSW